MSHSAQIVQFPGAPDAPRSPQLEDGYFRVSHELCQAFARAHLSGRERAILDCVMRYTYGFQRKQARITAETMEAFTGIHATDCARILNELIRRRIIYRAGGSRSPVGIQKDYSQWELPERANRRPKPKTPESGDNRQSQSGDNHHTYKDRKDTESPNGDSPRSPGGDHRVEPADDQDQPDDTPAATPTKAPPCPHREILAAWAEVMPDKPQPNPSLWADSQRAKWLAARWRQAWSMKRGNGEPFYRTQAEGIAWWGKFFAFLRKSEWLMRDDHNWFDLGWVVKRENFAKIYELRYHDQRKGGAR